MKPLKVFDYLDNDDDYSCFSATIEFKKVLSNIYVNIPILRLLTPHLRYWLL